MNGTHQSIARRVRYPIDNVHRKLEEDDAKRREAVLKLREQDVHESYIKVSWGKNKTKRGLILIFIPYFICNNELQRGQAGYR